MHVPERDAWCRMTGVTLRCFPRCKVTPVILHGGVSPEIHSESVGGLRQSFSIKGVSCSAIRGSVVDGLDPSLSLDPTPWRAYAACVSRTCESLMPALWLRVEG